MQIEGLITPDVQVLAYTNVAVNLLAAMGIRDATFDTFFPCDNTMEENIKKGLTKKFFIVDECMSAQRKHLFLLYQIKMRDPSIKFMLLGDWRQPISVEEDGLKFPYLETKLVQHLCDYSIHEMEYRNGRYTEETNQKLIQFEKTQTLGDWPALWDNPNEPIFHICMKHAKRDEQNMIEHAKFIRGQETITIDNLVLCAGMPLIATMAIKCSIGKISNGEHVLFVKPGVVLMRGTEMKIESFTGFRYYFAETVWRVLGDTIATKYNIHETSQMDWHKLYVALSRCRDWKDVGIAPTNKKFKILSHPKQKIVPLRYLGYFQPKSKFDKAPILEQNKPFKAIIYEKYDENDNTKNYFGCSLRRHVLRDAEHFNDPTNMAMGAWLHDPRSRPATRIISHMTF